MTKVLVFAMTLACAQFSFARTCTSIDDVFELTMTVTDGTQVQVNLRVDGKDATALRDCMWTPSVRRVLRCPVALADGTRAEVYPRYPTLTKYDKPTDAINKPWDLNAPVLDAKIVFPGAETVKLSCQD